MLSWHMQPRHWSPLEGYATGDVLLDRLAEGWVIREARAVTGSARAPLHSVTLERSGETLPILVLDGPRVRAVLRSAAA
jgi:hypothetical protein